MAGRTDWLKELESHWFYFKEAGWVTAVTYKPYDVATDAVAATGRKVDAVDEVERKEEREGPDGGKVVVILKRWHLRASQMAGAATKRGQIVGVGGTWVVESVNDVDGNEYDCETVLLSR